MPDDSSQRTLAPDSLLWIVVTLAVFGSLLIADYLRPASTDPGELAASGYVTIESARLQPLALTHHDGSEVGIEQFEGNWHLVFFGFSSCPDICPTTLSVLNQVVEGMGDRSPGVVMISVDPLDTAAPLGRYVQAFNKGFVGLTGSTGEIQKLATQLQVVFARTADDQGYSHTTNIALVDPRGVFVGYFKIPHRAEYIIRTLKALM